MFINNMVPWIVTYIATTHDGNVHVDFFFYILLYFKDYVTGLEVLTRLLYYLYQGCVVVSSHSSFIHYIEVELVLSAFKRTLVYYPYC